MLNKRYFIHTSKNKRAFEIKCTEFLNKSYGQYATFFLQEAENKMRPFKTDEHGQYETFCLHKAGNTAFPDIFVKTHSKKSFYIDVLLAPSLCGQFELLSFKDKKTFEYSSNNLINEYTYVSKIIDHLNNNFDLFSSNETAVTPIEMHDESLIFAQWIIQTFREKRTRFIITNDYIIFPIEQLLKHFNISARYRSTKNNCGKVEFFLELRKGVTGLSNKDFINLLI